MEGTTESLGKNHINIPEPSQSTKKEVCVMCRRVATDPVLELFDAYLNLRLAIVSGGKRGGREREIITNTK